MKLKVRKGRILGLLGPNGSGKSTLLKVISGLVIPDSGDVLVNNLSVCKDINRIMESVGVLIEEPGIYDYMNAMGNMNVSSILH
ncbi:MAG: ATP-binding cassette domain-containing protein [Youngiibacter sp.]|nr:ATP-binding cassette domain-containing protein [Youngiibacter sp.]